MAIFIHHMINDGKSLIVEQGRKQINILPAGVTSKKHVQKVEREMDHYGMREWVAVTFKNGHVAKLAMRTDHPHPITGHALQEFQATVLMIFDL